VGFNNFPADMLFLQTKKKGPVVSGGALGICVGVFARSSARASKRPRGLLRNGRGFNDLAAHGDYPSAR
jgi:hypothetical protein